MKVKIIYYLIIMYCWIGTKFVFLDWRRHTEATMKMIMETMTEISKLIIREKEMTTAINRRCCTRRCRRRSSGRTGRRSAGKTWRWCTLRTRRKNTWKTRSCVTQRKRRRCTWRSILARNKQFNEENWFDSKYRIQILLPCSTLEKSFHVYIYSGRM